jgi:hypothetical protein
MPCIFKSVMALKVILPVTEEYDEVPPTFVTEVGIIGTKPIPKLSCAPATVVAPVPPLLIWTGKVCAEFDARHAPVADE